MNRTLPCFLALTYTVFLTSCDSLSKKSSQAEISEPSMAMPADTVSVARAVSPEVKKIDSVEKPVENSDPKTANFRRVLTFKNITFMVKTSGKGSLQDVIIQPAGLSAVNRTEMFKTDPVINAEVADLNADGFPELLVFTQSAGSGSYGKVIAFSVNNGQSLSRATFPETAENKTISKDYRGHDKFTIVNNTLTQEFPLYNESDPNSKPTGRKRVITYKLQNGEASRVFVVDQVKEVAEK